MARRKNVGGGADANNQALELLWIADSSKQMPTYRVEKRAKSRSIIKRLSPRNNRTNEELTEPGNISEPERCQQSSCGERNSEVGDMQLCGGFFFGLLVAVRAQIANRAGKFLGDFGLLDQAIRPSLLC